MVGHPNAAEFVAHRSGQGMAFPAQSAALAELQGQQARLLVAVDFPCPVRLSLFAEFIANDRPLIASYRGEILFPVLVDYPEEKFGGFLAVTDYRDPVIQDEITANGWMIWPPIRYSYRTVNNNIPEAARAKPSWLYDRATRCAVFRRASTIRTAQSATGTGSAPTTRPATCWPA